MHSSHTPNGLPRTVANPAMGVTVTFLTANEESGGEYVEAEVVIPAGHRGPPPHFHTGFKETFTAVDGPLSMDLGTERNIALQPGQSVHVERGIRHRYFNDGDRDAVFRFLARPGRAYEDGIRAGFGLALDGRTNAKGVPRNPLEAALVFELSGSYVAGAPLWLQKGLVRAGVRLAKLRGHDPAFPQYTTTAGGRSAPERN